jgi:hypothetical protein
MAHVTVMEDLEVAFNSLKSVTVKTVIGDEGDLNYLLKVHYEGIDYHAVFTEEQLLCIVMKQQLAEDIYLEDMKPHADES